MDTSTELLIKRIKTKYNSDNVEIRDSILNIISGAEQGFFFYEKEYLIEFINLCIDAEGPKNRSKILGKHLLSSLPMTAKTIKNLSQEIILFHIWSHFDYVDKVLAKGNKVMFINIKNEIDSSYKNPLLQNRVDFINIKTGKKGTYDYFNHYENLRNKIVDSFIIISKELKGEEYIKDVFEELFQELGFYLFYFESVRILLGSELFGFVYTRNSPITKKFIDILANNKSNTRKRNILIFCLTKYLHSKDYKLDEVYKILNNKFYLAESTIKREYKRINSDKTIKSKYSNDQGQINIDELLKQESLIMPFEKYKREILS